MLSAGSYQSGVLLEELRVGDNDKGSCSHCSHRSPEIVFLRTPCVSDEYGINFCCNFYFEYAIIKPNYDRWEVPYGRSASNHPKPRTDL